MDVFALRDDLIESYQRYATSFLAIKDERVRGQVDEAFEAGRLWPPPQIGLNPAFKAGGTVDDLVAQGILHERCREVFRFDKSGTDAVGKQMVLHQHQVDAIHAAKANDNYVLTTGTGSGKSLSYIVPIVDHVLQNGSGGGVKAVVVYPMNALANSQLEELGKFLDHGPWGQTRPVSFARYTGQEDQAAREEILQDPPDIILTNYVMLELILTRYTDKRLVQRFSDLAFLVLDELHTYRGRQGADVSLLVRRLREAARASNLLCVGTSATMSSEGNHEQRQTKVAEVASTIFGAQVATNRVIGETLVRATHERADGDQEFVAALTESVAQSGIAATSYQQFIDNPLSSWIESAFGLVEEEGRLVRAQPLSIESEAGAAKRLSDLTGQPLEQCAEAIRTHLLAGYSVKNDNGLPAFAFRLHQFLSRGDTVYASPEAPEDRHITLTRQRFVPGTDRTKVLLPLAFCRECGQDYYVVRRQQAEEGTRLVPRELGDAADDDDEGIAGFLYLSTSEPWPDDPETVLEKLPPDWLDDQGRLRPSHREHVPDRFEVNSAGGFGDTGVTGWWIPTPFRFCLSCGVSYASRLGGDYSRLSTLGSDGRSTATTIMSLATIQHLRATHDLSDIAKKLLSFTDNRQDASLQAGHFNDFVQVTLLRAALYEAAKAAGAAGLSFEELPHRVFEALRLPFEEYALEPELKGLARQETQRALQGVLAYRIYQDLERGWRLTQPNLEQTGLLKIEYPALDELASDESEWSRCHPQLAGMTPKTRAYVLRVLLDMIRRDVAVEVDVLKADEQDRIKSRSDQRLKGGWAIEDDRLRFAPVVVPRGRTGGDVRDMVYVSARGGYGQFLRRPNVLGRQISLKETDEIIQQLFERLRIYGMLADLGQGKDGITQYQLKAAAMRWVAGNGEEPYQDFIRMPNAPERRRTNDFFVELYKEVGDSLRGVEAREHTAQVPYQDRLDREERFRKAELPVLYCSPTMELGVDISQLNVVNMRNVPPTPANYAQRSGRAGRSGQPALVFTYCAAGNSHDQHYFQRPEQMVAGQVEAPRLDLANEDLVRAHVYAIWLAESGIDLGSSMTDVLELVDDVDDPPIYEHIAKGFADGHARARAKTRAESVLADLGPRLSDSPWWYGDWLDDAFAQMEGRFVESLNRWRSLYKAAMQQAREQSKIKQSASSSSKQKRDADRLRREAENQLELLRPQRDTRNQSDFYTYRYFASEGFLPGYSFPRLPLSAFIPGRRSRFSDPEFLQRPRFLAINEFGPQSLVYHEGARYRINRVMLPVGDLETDDGGIATQEAKQCNQCGYLHPLAGGVHPDVCVRCGNELPAPLQNLFRLQNVSTVRRDRITSDEEERQRKGYEIISGIHFAERGQKLSVEEAVVRKSNGEDLLHLAYGDTATIWRINLGWRRRKIKEQRGFVLDIERGYWSNQNDAEAEDGEDPMSNRTKRVVPYVEDTRNVLLARPALNLSIEEMSSLQAALKVAFQVVFQLEDDEVAAEPLPSVDERHQLLFYESAEGGAGALRRLVDEPALWHRVAEEALRRCHIEPDTGEELQPPSGENCEAACYDCLLSYRNQIEHQLLDRKAAKPVLDQLRSATLSPTEQVEAALDAAVESSLEQRFLDYLRAHGHRLPDDSQVYIEEANTRVDFLYTTQRAAIYIDGPHHDEKRRQERDAEQEAALRRLGLKVIRLGYMDDWPQVIESNSRVFGEAVK